MASYIKYNYYIDKYTQYFYLKIKLIYKNHKNYNYIALLL